MQDVENPKNKSISIKKNRIDRPKKNYPIDLEKLRKFAEVFLPNEDIVALLDVPIATFKRHLYSEDPKDLCVRKTMAKARAEMRYRLLRAQFDVAFDDNNKYSNIMKIWLGKNYCYQSDEGTRADLEPIRSLNFRVEGRDDEVIMLQ